jgi:hypothetical protein
MPTTVVERFGATSATACKKEATFGTPVTGVAGDFTAMEGNSLNLDPGLFWPKIIVGQRDQNVFPLYGQFKNAGSLDMALMPTNAAAIIPGTLGADAAIGFGITGASPTTANTLNGGTTAGASTVTLTSATGYTVGTFIQVDVNLANTTTSEVRKITVVAANVLTLDAPLVYGHLSGAATAKVVAPFTHSITQTNFSLPSFTIEKNLGGFEALQFAGARFSKLDLKCQATNSEVTVSADVMAKSATVMTTPTTPVLNNEMPYQFAECAVSLFGNAVNQASTAELTLSNTLKDTYTMNSSHNLNFLSPVARVVNLKSDIVFTSLDDPTWGYFTLMQNQALSTQAAGAFNLSITHPNNAGAWTFTCPTCYIKSYSDSIKIDDIIISSVAMDAALNVSTNVTMTASLVSPSVYLAY